MRKARKMPPLNSLRVFEAAARRGSFTAAAEELSVTQSAISKQIKQLEDYLCLKLFERRYQQVILTEKSEKYLPAIQSAFDSISAATDQLYSHSKNKLILRLNLLPSLSNRWLIPMLSDFKRSYPQISLNIEIGDGDVDFTAGEVDIAIRVSRTARWKGIYVEKLMDEKLIPVCSPNLKLSLTREIFQYPLLKHTSRPEIWGEYLTSLGHKNIEVEHRLGVEHFFMLIDAAVDGLGVALVPALLVENELAAETLVSVLDNQYKSSYSYYFLCKEDRVSTEKVALFKQWLFSKTC